MSSLIKRPSLRKNTEPKQCPLGTVLKNGALFSKKGTKTVPFWQSPPPHQHRVPKGHNGGGGLCSLIAIFVLFI